MSCPFLMRVSSYLEMLLGSIIRVLCCLTFVSAAAEASSGIAITPTSTALASQILQGSPTRRISTLLTQGMSERLLTPTTTLEMRPQSQPSKQLVITITLSAVGVVIVCAIVFVITAAVVACVKKKGKYTFGSPRGRDEASESMTMNPLYHGWSTPPPNRSKPEMSTTMNAMCEPSRLRTPDTADRHASAASERLYASIHQRTMFQGHTVRSIGDPASTCSHIADDIETKMNEAYAANDLESFKITTPTPHSQSAYDYIVLQDT